MVNSCPRTMQMCVTWLGMEQFPYIMDYIASNRTMDPVVAPHILSVEASHLSDQYSLLELNCVCSDLPTLFAFGIMLLCSAAAVLLLQFAPTLRLDAALCMLRVHA